ncbi:MAG: hypothetical protein AAB641_01385 [Patescibacteria group bacterium]
MTYKKNILVLGLLLLILAPALPIPLRAQELPSGPIPGLPSYGSLPTVPIRNPAFEAKETGIKIFGFNTGMSWDGIAIAIAKKFIERMVDSTVKWINNGFEGNPGYVTDPKQYFSDIADGVAGDFIAGSDLNYLCSPFQTQVRLALLKSYNELLPFQCTLTGVVKNIEGFYDDFSQGGWDGWFAMTQNNVNNPYGAYLEAKIELDSRLAEKLGIESQKLDWGKGFLSWQDCIEWEILPGPTQDGQPLKGQCLKRGPIKTPGSIIESQLENTLGTGLRQLELADEFDELIGALLGQLLEKSVFSAKGLFQASKVSSGPFGPSPEPQGPQAVDSDGDGIPDGTDSNGDGEPDTCFFGDSEQPPCVMSREAIPGGQPASLFADVEAEFGKYPVPQSSADRGKMLNAIAWKNKDAGWVLLGKAGGTNCPSPSGAPVSCDFLVHKPTMLGYDVFTDTSATWIGPDASIGNHVKQGGRTLVDPVAP